MSLLLLPLPLLLFEDELIGVMVIDCLGVWAGVVAIGMISIPGRRSNPVNTELKLLTDVEDDVTDDGVTNDDDDGNDDATNDDATNDDDANDDDAEDDDECVVIGVILTECDIPLLLSIPSDNFSSFRLVRFFPDSPKSCGSILLDVFLSQLCT